MTASNYNTNASILIVDDNLQDLNFLFYYLDQVGFTVLVAEDGKSAIEQAQDNKPDLILLDIMMPGMSGFEICQHLKSQVETKDIPIIFMTALADIKNKVEGFEMGAVDYVTKPFQSKEILARVNTHLALHNLQKQLAAQNTQLEQEIVERKRAEEVSRVYQTELEIQNIKLRQTQQQLLESRDRYGDLYNFAPVGYFSVDEKGLILKANLTGVTLLEMTDRNALIKQTFSRFVVEESQDTFELHRQQIFKTKARQTCILKMVKKDSTQFDAQLESIVVQDDEGEFSRFRTAIIDITERKRVEEALHDSFALIEQAKKEWEATVDSLPQLVCLLDRQGYIIRTNRTVERWGLAQITEAEGQEVHTLFHPDCLDPACYLASFCEQEFANLIQGHSIDWEAEDKVLKRYLHFQARPITTKKTIAVTNSFGIIVVHDITAHKQAQKALQKAHDQLEQRVKERTTDLSEANSSLKQEIDQRKQAQLELQQSEEHLRQIITSISDHVYVTKITEDNQRINLYISPNAEDLTGYPMERFIEDWNFWNLTVIQPDDKAMTADQALTLSKGQDSEIEYRLVRANDEVIWVRDSARVTVDDKTKIIYGVVSNITVRKQAEAKLWQHAERLRILHEIDYGILTAQSPEAIARAVLHKILQLVSCRQVSVTLFDFAANEILMFTVSQNPDTRLGVKKHISLQDFGDLVDLQQGQARIINNLLALDNPTGIEKMLINEDLHSVISLPFIARGELIGSLNLASMEFDTFTVDHMDIAREVASQLTVAIMQNRIFEAEAQRRQEAEALRDTATALNSSLDLEEVLRQILANVERVVPHEAANIALIEDNTVQVIGGWDTNKSGWDEIAQTLFAVINQNPHLIKSRQPLTIEDTQADCKWKVQWYWVRAYMGIPICLNEQVIGFLNLASSKPNFFAANHTKHLQVFANQAAVAIQNARLHTQAETQAMNMASLNIAGQAMTSTLDLNTVLELVMKEANTLVGAEGTAVLLYDQATDELVFAAVVSPSAEKMMGVRVPINSSIAGWALLQKAPILVKDARNDPRLHKYIDTTTGLTTRSILAVPLICGQETIGVLESTNKAEGMFNQSDLKLLTTLTNSAAIAIQNARLFEQLQAGRERLRELTNQVISAQEEERQRLSYELHDESGQILTALKIRLEFVLANFLVDAEAHREHLSEAVAMADMTMERLRAIARDLRPPALDTTGLNSTLEGLCHEFAGWTKLSINYQGTEVNSLPGPVKITLYRFLQEALTNIAKHAQASQVLVNLNVDDHLVHLQVQDNGRGFDEQALQDPTSRPKGIGMLGMQERLELLGGWLEIETSPGYGTSLTAHIPLEEHK